MESSILALPVQARAAIADCTETPNTIFITHTETTTVPAIESNTASSTISAGPLNSSGVSSTVSYSTTTITLTLTGTTITVHPSSNITFTSGVVSTSFALSSSTSQPVETSLSAPADSASPFSSYAPDDLTTVSYNTDVSGLMTSVGTASGPTATAPAITLNASSGPQVSVPPVGSTANQISSPIALVLLWMMFLNV